MERIRSIRITIEVDTNKQTYRRVVEKESDDDGTALADKIADALRDIFDEAEEG